ncbi:MAG: hypothetical protein JXA94_05285 [Parachlamydiales bacterium]|nr:hypothetical protein [Parachlamydiales bacterium]
MATIAKTTHINQNSQIQQTHQKKAPKNAFDASAEFFGSFPKDVFRILRLSSEWARLIIADLEVFEPLGTFIKAIKTGEEALCFPEFGKSFSTISANSIKFFKHGDKSVISDLRTSSFQGVWELSKVVNWFDKVSIPLVSSNIATKLSAFGGTSFAISSSERMYNEGTKLVNLNEKSKHYIKDPLQKEKLYHVLRVAKNIGTLIVGIIVALKGFFGILAPAPAMLIIGTMILTSSISSTILKESFHLKLN